MPRREALEETLSQASRAAELGNWDAAVDGFREVLNKAGQQAPEALKKNLAVCLANRGMAAVDRAMKAPPAPEMSGERALAQALESLSAPEAPLGSAYSGRGSWRSYLRFSWGGTFFGLIALAPLWLPALLWMTGSASGKDAGKLVYSLFFLIWIFVPVILWIVITIGSWVVGGLKRLMAYDPLTPKAPNCEVKGCGSSASYQVDLDQIAGGSSFGGHRPRSMHLCSSHSQRLEKAMRQQRVSLEAVSALFAAQADLLEALGLDPEQSAIQENLRQVNEMLGALI